MLPIDEKQRIESLDYMRGFALLGILLVNVLGLLSVKVPAPHSADSVYQNFLFLLVEGRFYTIFSFLFGVGFFLFISRAFEKGNNGIVLFLRRILVLFVIGLIHVHFHPGDALTVYAVCGLILLPLYFAPKAVNLVLALVMLMVFGLFSIKAFMALPLVLLGIALGQYRLFERISRKGVLIFTAVMLAMSGAALFYQYQAVPAAPFQIGEGNPFVERGIMAGPIISAGYAGLLLLLLQMRWFRKMVSLLKSYGRMALTNYCLQTVLMLLVGYGWNSIGRLTYLESFEVCIAIHSVQLAFSVLWLRAFRFGPLEWLWRVLTYGKMLPIRIKQ